MVAWLISLGALFGHSYGAVRLPFVIAEALAALAAGMAAKILTGSSRAGAYAAIVFALIPQTKLEFAECIPDGAYITVRGRSHFGPRPRSAGAFHRRRRSRSEPLSPRASTRARSGWALVFGIAGWAIFTRRDLLRPVAIACAMTVVAYVPFLLWNASVGWETFAFEFVHRQTMTFGLGMLLNVVTLRTLLYGLLILGLTWFVALRRAPVLPLVAWTALPLPVILLGLSFATQTETYWILGAAASLAIGCGAVLGRARGALSQHGPDDPRDRHRSGDRSGRLSGAARGRAGGGLPRRAVVAASVRIGHVCVSTAGRRSACRCCARRNDLHGPLRDVVGIAAIGTIPSDIVVERPQLAQWMRWYRPATVPQHAELVLPATNTGAAFPLPAYLSAAYARVGPSRRLDYRFAGEPEATFYVTPLDGALPASRRVLPGI